jgi:hypothetical protein
MTSSQTPAQADPDNITPLHDFDETVVISGGSWAIVSVEHGDNLVQLDANSAGAATILRFNLAETKALLASLTDALVAAARNDS